MLRYFVAMALLVTPAYAVEWFGKPVQCDTASAVTRLMKERNQEPLFAGIGHVKVGIDDPVVNMPVMVFANTEDKTYHVIEYNMGSNQVCIVSMGSNLDFNAADWYYKE